MASNVLGKLLDVVEAAVSEVQAEIDAHGADAQAHRSAAATLRTEVLQLRRENAELEKANAKLRKEVARLEQDLGYGEARGSSSVEASTAEHPPEGEPAPWRVYTNTDSFEFRRVQGRRMLDATFERYVLFRLFETSSTTIADADIRRIANLFNIRYKRVLDLWQRNIPPGYEDNFRWHRRRVVDDLRATERAEYLAYERVMAKLEPLRRLIAMLHDAIPHTGADLTQAFEDLGELTLEHPILGKVAADTCLAADLAAEAQRLTASVAARIDSALAVAVANEPLLSRIEVHYTFDKRPIDLCGPSDAARVRAMRARNSREDC